MQYSKAFKITLLTMNSLINNNVLLLHDNLPQRFRSRGTFASTLTRSPLNTKTMSLTLKGIACIFTAIYRNDHSSTITLLLSHVFSEYFFSKRNKRVVREWFTARTHVTTYDTPAILEYLGQWVGRYVVRMYGKVGHAFHRDDILALHSFYEHHNWTFNDKCNY